MRLEEWQKWLDLQFLDSEEVAKPTEEPPRAQVAPVVTESAVAVSEAPPAPPSASPTLSPPLSEEAGVPSLERYLPFLRDRQAVVQAPPPQGEDAAAPSPAVPPAAQQVAPSDEAAAAPIGSDAPTTEEGADEPAASAPVKETTEPPSVSASAATARQDSAAQAPSETPSAPARRYGISHRRARHARNVRPADVVEEMSPTALWNLVPKHLQTLLTLETEEVAQNSYKRQFKESRLELINRLLDPTLSLEDAARLLNVCPTTVRRYTNKGLLTHQRTPGDQRRFKLSDVLAFLEAQGRAQTK